MFKDLFLNFFIVFKEPTDFRNYLRSPTTAGDVDRVRDVVLCRRFYGGVRF
ncbi:hypothetical protein HanIR_Chr08g0351241 [Helianthus annuus]|nr:hypothetical protein HanIR_Chr08g0351241 [Helianthus annuus]